MSAPVGARVVAIRDTADGNATVNIFGFGTYAGPQIPPGTGDGGFGDFYHEHGMVNPKVELDNGSVVWGYQCWWGPCEDEDELRAKLGCPPDAKVNVVPLPGPEEGRG